MSALSYPLAQELQQTAHLPGSRRATWVEASPPGVILLVAMELHWKQLRSMSAGQETNSALPSWMPYTFEVDHALNRSNSVVSGLIRFEEAVAFIAERELFCALGYPLLVEIGEAQLSLSGRDIVRLLPHLQRLVAISPLAPTAVVVTDKANRRVVQLVAAMATNLCCIRAFRTREAAEHWLGWAKVESGTVQMA